MRNYVCIKSFLFDNTKYIYIYIHTYTSFVYLIYICCLIFKKISFNLKYYTPCKSCTRAIKCKNQNRKYYFVSFSCSSCCVQTFFILFHYVIYASNFSLSLSSHAIRSPLHFQMLASFAGRSIPNFFAASMITCFFNVAVLGLYKSEYKMFKFRIKTKLV